MLGVRLRLALCYNRFPYDFEGPLQLPTFSQCEILNPIVERIIEEIKEMVTLSDDPYYGENNGGYKGMVKFPHGYK